jgi:lipopolysaccharide export system permease protein
MKIVTKYITKAVLGPLFFGIFAFTIMILGATFINLLREFEEYHLSLLAQLKMLSLYIPKNLLMGSTLAVLLATILGLGNLTGHSETIVMRAGGLSYLRLAMPVLLIGLAISGFGIFITEYIAPASYRVLEKMRTQITDASVAGTIYNFSHDFFNRDGNLEKRVYAYKFEPKVQQLEKVLIEEVTDYKISRTIEAEVMYWNGASWFFNQGRINQISSENFYPIFIKRGKVNYPMNLTPEQITESQIPPEEQSISELSRIINSIPLPKKLSSTLSPNDSPLKKILEKRRSLLVELYGKIAMPFASFIFALLGIPLALRPQRRSNAAGFGLCLLFMLLWWILYMIGTSMARIGMINPFLGAWLANLVTAGYGIYVFSKVKI